MRVVTRSDDLPIPTAVYLRLGGNWPIMKAGRFDPKRAVDTSSRS